MDVGSEKSVKRAARPRSASNRVPSLAAVAAGNLVQFADQTCRGWLCVGAGCRLVRVVGWYMLTGIVLITPVGYEL